MKKEETLALFQSAYDAYHKTYRREVDPVRFAHLYRDPKDQEVAAFLCALLAYGNVTAILKACEKVLSFLGSNPHQTLLQKTFPTNLENFYYRFTRAEDILLVFHCLSSIYRKHETLEGFYLNHRIESFVEAFWEQDLPREIEKIKTFRRRQLAFLLPSPRLGSACKRLNLFLRWVVRPADGVDLGLWKRVHTKELILPIDTHLLKILHRLKWTKSKQANWKMALEATEKLKQLDPEDPIRFDFSLCHLGMQKKLDKFKPL